MCTAGLVFAPDGGDFVRYEFLGRGCKCVGPFPIEAKYRWTASGSLSLLNALWMASSQGYVSDQMLLSTWEGLHFVYPCWPRRCR